jgi:hypothetical protein
MKKSSLLPFYIVDENEFIEDSALQKAYRGVHWAEENCIQGFQTKLYVAELCKILKNNYKFLL